MASLDDWPSKSSRQKLLRLSTKKLKQLCKSQNVRYSSNKSTTVNRLIKCNVLSWSSKVNILNIDTDHKADSQEKNSNIVLKVAILGDAQIGKQTLMVKYIEDKFDEEYTERLNINFMQKTISLKNVNVTISIWMRAQHQWGTDMTLLCSDAKFIIFAFDLTQKSTLFSVKRWYKQARKENKMFLPLLVGTKYDKYQQNNKEYKLDISRRARKFSEKINCPLIYCSSLMGINVKKIFKLIIAKTFDLTTKMKQIHDVNEPIFEWIEQRNKKKDKICTVYGYIHQLEKEFKWEYTIPIYDFANIILLFYANIVIGGNNKKYKVESKTHKQLQRKLRKEECERYYEQKRKQTDYVICVESE